MRTLDESTLAAPALEPRLPAGALLRRAGGRHPLAAALLSALLPGLGQLYARRPVRGLVMLLASAVLAAAGFALWARGSIFVLTLLVRPNVLLALFAANIVLFSFHAWAALDAYRLSAGRRRRRPAPSLVRSALLTAAVAAVFAAAAVPHAVAGYYDWTSYDLLVSVFSDDEPDDARPPVRAPGGVPPSGQDWPFDRPPPSQGAAKRGAPAPVRRLAAVGAPATRLAAPRKRINLLLLGGDAGPGRWGIRTDTMIVVSLAYRGGAALAAGVPRNLTQVPVFAGDGRYFGHFRDILNALYPFANSRSDLFGGGRDPGASALKRTIGALLGIHLDYYVLVDLPGFVEVVDALGGVTVNVQRPVHDTVSPSHPGEPWVHIDLSPGRHRLSGRQALAYVRSRHATSDYDRMQRQRCFLSAMAEQLSPLDLLRSFPRIASIVKRSVKTDVPIKQLPDLIQLLASIDPGRSVSVTFGPPEYSAGSVKGDPIPDIPAIHAAVHAALTLPTKELRERFGIRTFRLDCT